MKILILYWGEYNHTDILQTFSRLGIKYKVVNYRFQDKNEDDYFTEWFTKEVCADTYEAVFTVNYFPLIAEVCRKTGTKYLSWSYDCPLNVYDIENTLGYEMNYTFLYDRMQAENYQRLGFSQVYHLPLAVNVNRLKALSLTDSEAEKFYSEVSFVGNLYTSAFPKLAALLDDYTKGYLEAVMESQLQIYGRYFISEYLTDTLMNQINEQLVARNAGILLNKEQLAYAMSTYVTHRERLLLLKMLSEGHRLSLYAREQHSIFDKSIYKGTVSYITEMPKVFLTSKVNLNITAKNTPSGIPLRALDIMGSGGFLLSNWQQELVENFLPGQDCAVYESLEDALEKTDFYLSHEELRQKIARNGQEKCWKYFDYTERIKEILHTADIN